MLQALDQNSWFGQLFARADVHESRLLPSQGIAVEVFAYGHSQLEPLVGCLQGQFFMEGFIECFQPEFEGLLVQVQGAMPVEHVKGGLMVKLAAKGYPPEIRNMGFMTGKILDMGKEMLYFRMISQFLVKIVNDPFNTWTANLLAQ
jgi:hypothetical protein